ncbi:MAG TPA: glycosyltransferase family 39 protein [Solirubrobacteraceae bacterium]|nr:glycosyltransferase family 39 protein [Solirubrobacteraceae bacterium]
MAIGRELSAPGAWIALGLIAALAAALRFGHLGAVVGDPFYDGAVRSMTLSWHNFFFGAVEPSGAVAIDKPPVDLWLQVASVELFGFRPATLKLPEALGGTLAVVGLFFALRRAFGARAGLAAALALAVLPIEVITARSDTMDAVMMALMVLALLCAVRAAQSGRTLWLAAAAAALGVAFDVKLLESLVALPGLALLAWLGLPGRRRRRLAQLTLAAVVYVAVALSWLTATLLFPAHERAYAYGSTNGSAWNSAFVFNGLDRVQNKTLEGVQPGFIQGHHYPERTAQQRYRIPIVPPSPTRLLARIGPLSANYLGLEALAGLLLGAGALAALCWPRTAPPLPDALRVQRATLAGLMLWLLTGVVLFSHMARLHPRYTEGFTPAVAATLGIGAAWATARRTRGRLLALTVTLVAVAIYAQSLLFGTSALWWVTAAGALGALGLAFAGVARGALGRVAVLAATLVCLLAIPLSTALRAQRENLSDTNSLGLLHKDELGPLSKYLRAHQGSAYYEAAFDSGTKMGELVERDSRPILVLTLLEGKVFTSVARLRALAKAGRVRYAFVDGYCGPHSASTETDCAPPVRWVVSHGVDVSRQAGLPRPGMLWLLPGAPGYPHSRSTAPAGRGAGATAGSTSRRAGSRK